MPSELARYAEAIEKLAWIENGVTIDCFFAVEQSGHWTDDLRALLNDKLVDQGMVSELAAMFSPPGWSFEKGTLQRFLDEEKLREALESFSESDAFLARCRTRMLKLLSGEHWSDI